jgi:superfamily II DNA helicase RecQ
MQYRVFAVPATGLAELEEELNRFLRTHRVVTVQKSLERLDGAPSWCFCVEYLDGTSVDGTGRLSGSSKRIDYKEVLSEADFAIYVKLRDERKRLASSEAVPVYAVCTNEQLAAMATGRPESLAALKEIDGFGEAKAKKYGKALLAVLNSDQEGPDETSGKSD